jgi:hypothetical protein
MNIFNPQESVEITNKMQPCNRIYYSKIYWSLSMFRAAYRSSLGATNCICNLWFIYTCGDRSLWSLSGIQNWQRLVTTRVRKPEAAITVWSTWWWEVCRSKHVELLVNFAIINSITRLHLIGYFYWFTTTMHGSMNMKVIPYVLSNKNKIFVKNCLYIFLDPFVKFRKANINFGISFRPSVRQVGSHWTDIRGILYSNIFRKFTHKIQVELKYEKNNAYFTRKTYVQFW